MRNKKFFLITGGAGFIGSHTVDLLIKKNYKVRVIDNLSGGNLSNLKVHSRSHLLDFEKADIKKLNPDNKIFKNIDYIIHYAGSGSIVPSIERPNFYMQNNAFGTSKLLEASVWNKISKFIYAASSSCYGIAKFPISENHRIQCEHPYAFSKYYGEQLVLHWSKVYRLNVKSLRIFNAFGPRLTTKGAYGTVFAVFMKQILEKKPLTLVGSGNQKRDYVYVSDVAEAFIKSALSESKSHIFNIGSGNPISINKLIKILVGDKYKIVKLPNRPGEPYVTCANISRAKRELRWSPKVTFEKGVNEMLNNIEYWKDSPLWTKEKIGLATKTWFKYLG
jgi:UDP-glucose 4-epimerase